MNTAHSNKLRDFTKQSLPVLLRIAPRRFNWSLGKSLINLAKEKASISSKSVSSKNSNNVDPKVTFVIFALIFQSSLSEMDIVCGARGNSEIATNFFTTEFIYKLIVDVFI